MSGPLEGVRILELTSVVLGPWACQILADMGAEVIKVEAPRGDSNRSLGAHHSKGMAALYLTCNRNKRCIVLDLKQESGREALLKIVADVDIVVHNNRPQVMTRLGIDYEQLKAVNPKLIFCGSYGYGKDGPYGARGALDDSIQAASGIAMLQKMVLGEPRYLPTVVSDKTTAMAVVFAVTAALYRREKTGVGQEIEVPMFETMVYYVMAEHLWGMTFEPPLGPPGYTRLMSKDRKPYKTKDGYIAILPYLDSHWEVFCKLSGRTELIDDERFKTLGDRVKNIDATNQETAATMLTRTTAEWLEIFGNTSVPTIVVNTLEELTTDPHLNAVDFWQIEEHPTEGKLRMPRFPVGFSESPASIRSLPRHLGEDSVAVLQEFGVSEEDIQAMLDSGATCEADISSD
jgi:crotonobetainyl-CoA:carnitine CoA-transferase CaiB-like acyl-CoA transferase